MLRGFAGYIDRRSRKDDLPIQVIWMAEQERYSLPYASGDDEDVYFGILHEDGGGRVK